MRNNLFSITLSCCIALFLFVQSGTAQHKQQMTFKAGEIALIAGIGAIIKGGEKGLVVEMIPPSDSRQKEYKNVDLKKQDRIIMCNGKKIKTVDELNAALDKVAIGDEISFGVRRGKEMLIVSFPKSDPKKSGNMMMMTTTIDDDGEHTATSIMKDGVEMKDVVMLEAGMILKDIDGQVSILAILPEFLGIIEGEKPQEGDFIESFNGETNLTANQLNKKYNAINLGDKVSMTFSRDDKTHAITFMKPAVDDGGSEVIINKKG